MFLFYSVNALKNSKKQRKILPCELKVTFLFNPCELFTHSELLIPHQRTVPFPRRNGTVNISV
jgi:hypothetical protein